VAANDITGTIKRYETLRVPVDSIEPDRIEALAEHLIAGEGVEQIVLLRWWDFMRARRNREYRSMLQQATVVPVSKSIAMAVRMLHRHKPPRYMPFDFVIRLLGGLENKSRSIYLLGGSPAALRAAEQNLRQTFPGLKLVGRYAGHYPKAREADIITAIRKANPDILFVGPGLPGTRMWIARHRAQLSPGIYLQSPDVFQIFAERRKRGSRKAFKRGFDFLPDLLRRPWRILRVVVYVWFLLVLLVKRVFARPA
jgi:N-acetylglucosaminyldiphosphoundecaprenol N-acetyl-beta-D-mannosaminyltransferase